jgi:transposase
MLSTPFYRTSGRSTTRAAPRASSISCRIFVVLPKRWIVERTIAWLNRCRRLAKDFENLNRNARAFLCLASIRLVLRRLCNPC